MTIGDFIAACREGAKLSRADVAEALGINVNQIAKWESAQVVTTETLSKLSRIFRLPPLHYISGELQSGISPDEVYRKLQELRPQYRETVLGMVDYLLNAQNLPPRPKYLIDDYVDNSIC